MGKSSNYKKRMDKHSKEKPRTEDESILCEDAKDAAVFGFIHGFLYATECVCKLSESAIPRIRNDAVFLSAMLKEELKERKKQLQSWFAYNPIRTEGKEPKVKIFYEGD